MKARDIVCTTASVGAGIIWPPLCLTLVLGFVALLFWISDHLNIHIGRAAVVVMMAMIAVMTTFIWIANGVQAYRWVRAKCSPGKPGEPRG